jgi:HEAT repeat protein
VIDPKVREQLLTQQVAGLTPEKLFATLELGARGGVVPDHNHFLVQATGLLEQRPELCAKMVEVFQSPQFDIQGRALVLDLLANTGTPAAQEALTKALSTPEARGDTQYSMLLNRMALVTEPTVDTVRFLETTYGQTQGDVHATSAYMLGATAGALYRSEHSGEALAAVERLASDLRAAKSPRDQVGLLMSLGNAGVPEQTGTIVSYAQAEFPEVRRAAAKALRKIQTPQAQAALMSLVGDGAIPVQATAMESLGRRKLDAPSLVELRNLVISSGVRPENFHALVTLVEPYLATDPAVRDILEFLLTQDVQDRQIRTRIRGLLET